MAKRLFLLAAGALALTACTSEDVVDDVAATRNVIQFENVVNKHTRVQDLSSSTLERFNVFGFYTVPGHPNHANEVFHNVLIKRDPNDASVKWVYDNTDQVRYWIENATYYFYAYSCGNTSGLSESYGKFDLDMSNELDASNEDDTEGGKPAGDRVLTITGYQCDNDHQHDLVFASNLGLEGKATMNSTVAFQFSHILSKIKANFTNKMPSEYKIRIHDVVVSNIRNVGNYNFKGANTSDPENFISGWSDVVRNGANTLVILPATEKPESLAPYDVEKSDTYILVDNGASAASGSAYVIPMKYETNEVALNFKIDVLLNDDTVMKDKPLVAYIQPDWKDGHSYIYNIEVSVKDLSLQEITFTTSAEVIKWGDDENITASTTE